MVFTYYRIYVVASQQTRSLKMGVKQIEMSYIGGEGSAAEYRGGFILRMHRGGGAAANNSSQMCQPPVNSRQPASGTPVRTRVNQKLSFHSISEEKIAMPKVGSSEQCQLNTSKSTSERLSSIAINPKLSTSSDLGTVDFDANCVARSSTASTTSAAVAAATATDHLEPDNGRNYRNHHKANWSVGRRLAKLAKGKLFKTHFAIAVALV